MRYWVDTDAGVDDALALIWVFQQNFAIEGISTVAGNLPISAAINNVKALTEHYSKNHIPVYKGAGCSLLGTKLNASHIHGTNLGPIVIQKNYQDDGHIFEGLSSFFKQNQEQLTIITLGPLTNIATFLIHYPEYHHRIERIITMGGGSCGNIAPYGEFNIYTDPEAAHMVFSSSIPLVISDIDITDTYAYLSPEELKEFTDVCPLEDWAYQLLQFRVSKSHHPPAARIYDVLPFMFALYPDLFTYDLVPIDVQLEGKMRGYTAYDYHNNRENNFLFPEKNVFRAMRLRTIDRQTYINLFLTKLIKT